MGLKPEPRKHHYVPKCWLAGFTESGDEHGRLWVTDFSRTGQWQSTPANAGHIRDYYRLSDELPNPVVVENLFSEMEGRVAPILKSISRERRSPDPDELDALLRFMAHQWARVPSYRPFARGILNGIVRESLAAALQSPDKWHSALTEWMGDATIPRAAGYEAVKKWFESEWKLVPETDWYMQRALSDAEGVLSCLRRRFWRVSFTDHGRLIASDNPVLLDGEKDKLLGFKNAEVVLYPLSRHAFLTGTLERTRQPIRNFNYFASFNTMMLLRSHAQVYSHIPDFSWLDENRRHQTDWRAFSKEKF